MSRLVFTIILNGENHLKNYNYVEELLPFVDMWVFSEGASMNTGSTGWCKNMPEDFHSNGRSVDGTIEFINDLCSKYPDKVFLVQKDGMWDNKDEQVNASILKIKEKYDKGFLWQIDADEQWDIDDMKKSEQILIEENLKSIRFHVNQYVGKNLLAKGEWGEKSPWWFRLWNWNGELFERHEPPILCGGNEPNKLIEDIKFNHYSYFFEEDVIFKDKWYGGHDGIYGRWKAIQARNDFPIKTTDLIPFATNTDVIERVKK